MWEYLNSGLAVLLATTGISYSVVKQYAPQWALRDDYAGLGNTAPKLLTWSVLIASVLGAALYGLTGSMVIAILLGVMSYFLLFTAQTDYEYHRVPREFSTLAITVGALLGGLAVLSGEQTIMFTTGDANQLTLLSFIGYMVVITGMFGFMLFKPLFLGFADIKMFWAVGFFASWYYGYINMILVFMITNVLLFIQLIWNKLTGKGGKNIPVLPAFTVAVIIAILVVTYP